MIVASLVLIFGAVVLLVLGLINGSSGLLVGSIGTSLLAAVALVVGVRQAAAARAAGDYEDEADELEDEEEPDQYGFDASRAAGRVRTTDNRPPRGAVPPPARAAVPDYDSGSWGQAAPPPERGGWADEQDRAPVGGRAAAGLAEHPVQLGVPSQTTRDEYVDEDPPDEPVAQRVSPADAARVARMSTDVLVIDGRPRYHVAGCVHLLGRPYEPLAVSEAVELGFTPCGLCEPDSALLADARRV